MLSFHLISFSTDVRTYTVNGKPVRSHEYPKYCHFIGSAYGGEEEYGLASLSTCGGKIVSSWSFYGSAWAVHHFICRLLNPECFGSVGAGHHVTS